MQLKTCLVYKFVFLLFNIRYSSLEQTNKLDCADENCTVPIGLGKAEVTISRNVEGFLTMKAGEEAQIFGVFGKDLFLIETGQKKRGFVSQKLFRELKLKKKGLVKSNVTAAQRTRLNQMGPKVKDSLIQDPPKESEIPEVKIEGKTAAGQVIFAKEEQPEVKSNPETNVTEKSEEGDDEEEEDENATNEADEEEEEEEEEETPAEEESMLSKLAHFITGGDEADKEESSQNETSSENEQILVQNDTQQEILPQETQTNNNKPEVIQTTTPVPEYNDIVPPVMQEAEGTTPTPILKTEEKVPETVLNLNETEKDLGNPDFKPIPTEQFLNETETKTEEVPEPKVQEMQMPGTGKIITTPPPLLGLMKSQIIKSDEKKPEVPVVVEEPVKSLFEESAEIKVEEKKEEVVQEVKPEVVSEVKPEEINKIVEVPKKEEIPAPVVEKVAETPVLEKVEETPISVVEKVEESKETVVEVPKEEEISELDKVKEKLGVAEEEKPKLEEEKPKLEEEKPKLEELKPVETPTTTEKPEEVQPEVTKQEEVTTEAPITASSLGIDTYGNPPPPMKPLEDVQKPNSEEKVQIDDKLDLQEEPKVDSSSAENITETPVVEQSQEVVTEEPLKPFQPHDHHHHGHHHHHHEHKSDPKNDFQQKREAIRNILEADVHQHGSEVDSSENKQQPELPNNKKQGVPSIIEIRRNGKIITPKDVPVEEDEQHKESNPHSGEYCDASGGSCPADSTSNTISNLIKMFGLDFLFQEGFLHKFAAKTFEMFDLIIYLSITASAVTFFLLMHSCVKRCMRESPLLDKINRLERTLMTSIKENATLKNDLFDATGKLHQIEDNSFGSNEMVIALKKDLDDSEHIRHQLQQQCNILEDELQRSTVAGNELNKMLSDLLNTQTGSESILQSVEQLQKQLDEQQFTIESMTEALSTKSRENSELQVQLSEVSSKLGLEVKSLKARNDDVELEKICIENELKNLKKTVEEKIETIERSKFEEIERIKQKLARKEKEALELHQKYRTSEAKIQALNEMINENKQNGGDAGDYLDSIDAKAELILVTKERDTIKEQLTTEINSKKSLDSYVKGVGEDIEKLKKEFSVAEKEKLEAQTKLDVLSSYFRQKESELQRELSTKEALWMQQQGETTTTVERVKSMQEEIQQLKSQNDSLKAEILAQDAANKAQIVSLENKAHEAWLNARQSERKVEELRQESTILRRRLTSIAELQPGSANNSMNNSNLVDTSSGMPSLTSLPSLNSVPSPLRVESPNSPIMLPGMPPPPQFLPPGQFMPPSVLPPGVPPPLPFMPPPPFDLAGRQGRIISPQPRGYSPSLMSDRYSPDSRYHDDYSVMSTRYDTETDFSPPPSPPKRNTSSGYNRQMNGKMTSPQMNGRHNHNNNNNSSSRKPNKGGFNSSGSQDSIIGSGSRKGHHGKI